MTQYGWENWAQTESCSDCVVVEPKTLEELQKIIRKAAGEKKRIRASGGKYSWAPLVPNCDVIISMVAFKKIEIDRRGLSVRVQSGATIEELTERTCDAGVTLISPTLFPLPTIGGVVATGSHGTGMNTGNFCDQILEIEIVNYLGEHSRIGRNHKDFHALQVSLGSMGIIVSVKLLVEESFNVYTDKRKIPMQYVLEEFDDLIDSYEFPEMMYFPLQSHVWVYLMDRTKSFPDKRSWWMNLRDDFNAGIERFFGSRVVPWLARNAPQLTPKLNALSSRAANQVEASVDPASRAFHFQRAYPKCYVMSYGVPRKHIGRAWKEAMALIDEFARAKLYPVNLALHCRFTKESDAWLGANYGRETAFIEVATALDTPHWEDFFKQLEQRWSNIPDARPHWGKVYFRRHDLRDRYPMMKDFLEVRERWDPDRVFLNSFLEDEIFQLNGPALAAPLSKAAPTPSATPSVTPSTKPSSAATQDAGDDAQNAGDGASFDPSKSKIKGS
jgi:hypothetical protein